uniref:Shisa family member 5 n=1 Tax=Mandrillus leucophaeus TaxID=9568 RepID=A0A2K5ZRH6_MANLE
MGFKATLAVGLTIFVLSVVTIIICFTCSCWFLYKTVPPSYPGPSYQGYHTMPPQPGMPAAPYPMQYPSPYPAQLMGPPAYHKTLAGGAAAPYPASQPPYNPAYMDAPKAPL